MTSDQDITEDAETATDLCLENRLSPFPTNVELNTFSSEEQVTEATVDYDLLHIENFWSEDYEDVTADYSKESVTEAPD